jgi:thiamine biosynthesis lipoprotein
LYRSTHCQLIKFLLFGVFVLVGCERQPQLIEQRILQFGTIIDISLIHEDSVKSEQALIEIEQQLSAYRQSWHAWEDSELTRFNQALNATRPVEIPVSLVELINMSPPYYLKTTRLFNPALGKLIAAYGFHGQLDPDEQTISIIQKDLPNMLDLKVQNGFATSNNKHMKLDFGGIAKGYAVALVADYLHRQGFENYLINVGGDLVSSGSKFGKAWKIAIARNWPMVP